MWLTVPLSVAACKSRPEGCVMGMATLKLFGFLMWDNHRHAREWHRALLGEWQGAPNGQRSQLTSKVLAQYAQYASHRSVWGWQRAAG